MLYYARSENTEKDYFVKQLQLDEVIHNVTDSSYFSSPNW